MRLNLIASPVEADAAGNNDAARKSNRNDAREVTQLTSQFGERKLTSDHSLFGNDHEVRYVDFILHRCSPASRMVQREFRSRPRLSNPTLFSRRDFFKKPC